MKRTASLVTALAIAAGISVFAQTARELNFDANADILNLPSYGEVAGVATNSRGNVFVYARTGHAVATLGDERTFYHGGSRLFQFDQSGKFVKEIGQGVYGINFAQQVRVDPQDNIWIVDAGSNQVFKFDPDGKLLLVLGRKPESISLRPGPGVPARAIDIPKGGAAPEAGRGEGRGGGGGGGRGGAAAPGAGPNGDNFNRPSDVTWDKAGNVYVADGYGSNNRIAKFTRDGNFVKTWGQTGSGQGQFNGIRGLAIDAAGNLYAADAGNKRIQVFDGEGTFKSQIGNIGIPQAICITGGSTQYLYSSNSNDLESLEGGEIYKLQLNGQVVGKFGKAGKLPKEFGVVNAIDCRTDNNLWVGEVLNWRAQKVTLKP
jgi:DNA-binding beta-propeller fold protein YncE